MIQIDRSRLAILLVSLGLISQVYSLQSELSIIVEAGKRECFHQFLVPNLVVETDYQVLSGGDLDVSYWISSPTNRVLFTEVRRQGGQTQLRTEERGEYRFCFDNSFSRFQHKQVFFFLSTGDNFVDPFFPQGSSSDPQQQQYQAVKDQLGAELDGKLENIQESFHRVSANLEKAQRMQSLFRGFELIDRNAMEESYERVNFWSVVNIAVLLVVAVIQVFMIRSLFEDRSKVGKVLRAGMSGVNDSSSGKIFT